MTMGTVRTAVFPIAGLGTRFLPATKAVTKEMLPVVDRPLLEYAVREAQDAGIERFVFVVSTHNDLVTRHFSENPELEEVLESKGKLEELESVRANSLASDSILYAIQDQPLGLGHAVLCAQDVVQDEFFAVLLPDDVMMCDVSCIKQMVDVHGDTGGSVLALERCDKEHISNYGCIRYSESSGHVYRAEGVVEKPKPENAPSNLAVIGRYVLSRRIFSYLENIGTGFGGEIQLTDAINSMAAEQPVHGLEFEGRRYDCGSKAGYIAANIAFARRDPELMSSVEKLL